MSGILIRATVRDMLREHLGLSDQSIMVMDDSKSAHPTAPPVFIGVSPGRWKQWSGWKIGPTLDEEFGIAVTISAKTGAIQPQLYGEKILQRADAITTCGAGIEMLCREIVTHLHDNPDLTCTLNTAAGAVQYTGGLFFADGGRAERRQPSWWMCAGKKDDAPIGMSQTIEFYGLRRTQQSVTAI